MDGESAPKASDILMYMNPPSLYCVWPQILNRRKIGSGSSGSGCPSTGVNEQGSKDPPDISKWVIVVTVPPTACATIRMKRGQQSRMSFPVTAYTLNQSINLISVKIRSRRKRMSRPHCDRHLCGKRHNSCVYHRDPSGSSATDNSLSGLRIDGREMGSHLQVDP